MLVLPSWTCEDLNREIDVANNVSTFSFERLYMEKKREVLLLIPGFVKKIELFRSDTDVTITETPAHLSLFELSSINLTPDRITVTEVLFKEHCGPDKICLQSNSGTDIRIRVEV